MGYKTLLVYTTNALFLTIHFLIPPTFYQFGDRVWEQGIEIGKKRRIREKRRQAAERERDVGNIIQIKILDL